MKLTLSIFGIAFMLLSSFSGFTNTDEQGFDLEEQEASYQVVTRDTNRGQGVHFIDFSGITDEKFDIK